VIRIDAVWLATQPVDMRAGADRLLSMVVAVFGSAQVHHGYLFTNARAEQTTFSIPIPGCRDRVPVAPAAR
jgi:transposase